MKRNRSLSMALRFAQFCFGVAILMFVLFITVMIIGLLELPLADKISLPNVGSARTDIGIQYCRGGSCGDLVDTLSFFASPMKWWILFRGTLLFLFKILIVWRAIVLLKAVIHGNTFYEENIRAFLQMAKYGLIVALIGLCNFRYDDPFDGEPAFTWQVDLPFGALLFVIGCKVLAEIFKQGKLLSEENQSFV